MVLCLRRPFLDQGLAIRRPEIRTDATASQALASRRGVGRIKHLSTTAVWLQAAGTCKGIKMTCDAGQGKPADWGTKPLARPRMEAFLCKLAYGTGAGGTGWHWLCMWRPEDPGQNGGLSNQTPSPFEGNERDGPVNQPH